MAKNCTVCGFELQDTDKFCNSCGTPNEAAAPVAQAAPAVNYNAVPQMPVYTYAPPVNTQTQVPPAGLSVGAFFGLNILFGIPFVGFVFAIVMSFAPKNKTLKNFARSHLIWYIVAAALAVTAFIFISLVLGEADIIEEIFEEIFYIFEDIFDF